MNHVELPIVITPTRVESGLRCHRRHFLGDVLNRESYRSPSLEFGTLIHSATSAHWLGQKWKPVVDREWNERFERTTVSQESVSLELAYSMMEHYVATAALAGPFQDSADDWQLVDVEQRFRVPLDVHYKSFQMDRILYSKSQDWLVIGDTKTAARLDKRWERQWETSPQMKLYKAGSRKVFEHEGKLDVFIEGLHKHVPSKIQYYVCPEWSHDVLGEALYNAKYIADLDRGIVESCVNTDGTYNVQNAEELGVRYTTVNYHDCFSYGTECPFYKVCTADVNERVGILRGEFTEKTEEDY